MTYRETRRPLGMLLALGILLAMSRHADAASMLRCESEDSSVSYVSTRIGNAKCSRVSMNWQPTQPSVATTPDLARPRDDAPAAIGSRQVIATRREVTTRIYSYVEDGVRHYLTRRPSGVAANVSVIELRFMETCNLCAPADNVNVGALLLDTHSYRREIDAAAESFGVDSALVRAVIHAESAWRANAISRKGAQGLMQLMPATATRFNVADPFDAAQNIRGGVQYLSWLMKRFGGDLDLVLAAYNSGEGAVGKYNGVPPYGETKTYVSRVKALTQRYRGVE